MFCTDRGVLNKIFYPDRGILNKMVHTDRGILNKVFYRQWIIEQNGPPRQATFDKSFLTYRKVLKKADHHSADCE